MKVKKSSIPEKERVYNRILRFATIRPRSAKEIELWFKRKKVNLELIEGLFNQLKESGLVDDLSFAKWWIDQRVTFRPKSKRALVYELQQKGIDKFIIEDALESVEVDEVSLARRIIEKKVGRFSTLPSRVKRQKISELLARRGFSWNVIKETLDLNDEIG